MSLKDTSSNPPSSLGPSANSATSTVPSAPTVRSALEGAAERLIRSKRRAILLVEDTAAHAALIRRALDPASWEIEHVTRAATATASFSADPDRIVLLDLTLPDSEGLSVLGLLQKISPGAAVIVVTAREEVPITVEAMQNGAWNYVVKGSPQETAEKIREAVEQAWNKRMKDSEAALIEQSRILEMMRNERLHAIELIVRTVCHEVNNPLSGVVALSQLLSRNDSLDDNLKRLAEGIMKSAQDVARVVQKLHSIGDTEKDFGGKKLFDLPEGQAIEGQIQEETNSTEDSVPASRRSSETAL